MDFDNRASSARQVVRADSTPPQDGQSNDQNLWIPGGRAFPEDDRRSHRILIKTSVGALAGRHARA
ncbi:hypothetical protein, partial [Nocardia puris]|uniref:hypothetical protein n=1 Tax=Nocardia puris TaxID=208602 RepID=UPI001E3DE924